MPPTWKFMTGEDRPSKSTCQITVWTENISCIPVQVDQGWDLDSEHMAQGQNISFRMRHIVGSGYGQTLKQEASVVHSNIHKHQDNLGSVRLGFSEMTQLLSNYSAKMACAGWPKTVSFPHVGT